MADGHRQRAVRQARVVVLAERVPQDPARAHVKDGIEVQLAFPGGDLGAVPVPLAVDPGGREVPPDQVRCALACCRPFPCRVVCLRPFRPGRAARPCSRIRPATVFSLTVQPASRSAAAIRGAPSFPSRTANSRATSAFSRCRRAARGGSSPSFHL